MCFYYILRMKHYILSAGEMNDLPSQQETITRNNRRHFWLFDDDYRQPVLVGERSSNKKEKIYFSVGWLKRIFPVSVDRVLFIVCNAFRESPDLTHSISNLWRRPEFLSLETTPRWNNCWRELVASRDKIYDSNICVWIFAK